jgi:hypothetical protein
LPFSVAKASLPRPGQGRRAEFLEPPAIENIEAVADTRSKRLKLVGSGDQLGGDAASLERS